MDDHFRRMLEPSPHEGASSRAPFIASRTFNGPKPGYYFSNGTKGVGYYLDRGSGGGTRAAGEENGKVAGGGKKRKLEVSDDDDDDV